MGSQKDEISKIELIKQKYAGKHEDALYDALDVLFMSGKENSLEYRVIDEILDALAHTKLRIKAKQKEQKALKEKEFELIRKEVAEKYGKDDDTLFAKYAHFVADSYYLDEVGFTVKSYIAHPHQKDTHVFDNLEDARKKYKLLIIWTIYNKYCR